MIAVIASGEETLKIMIASWSWAAPMAQAITAAPAQNSPRCSISHPFVRFACYTRFKAKDRALRDRYGERGGPELLRFRDRELGHNGQIQADGANYPVAGQHARRRDRGCLLRR